jgi:hypothetical protein
MLAHITQGFDDEYNVVEVHGDGCIDEWFAPVCTAKVILPAVYSNVSTLAVDHVVPVA